MLFFCKNNNESNEKKYIFEKLTPILPQDIIGCLIFEGLIDDNDDLNEIKTIYENITKYNNIIEFIEDKENFKYKFSIIYTFSSLSEQLADDKLIVQTESDLKSEKNIKKIILEEFYKDDDLEILAFKIQVKSVEEIIYLKSIINAFEESYKANNNYNGECDNKKFIFTVHISRLFKTNKEKQKNLKKLIQFLLYR